MLANWNIVVTRLDKKPAWNLGAFSAGYWRICVHAAIACPMAFILAVTIALSSASLAIAVVAQLIVSGLIAKGKISVIFLIVIYHIRKKLTRNAYLLQIQ